MQGEAVATQWHQCDLRRAVAPTKGGTQPAREGATAGVRNSRSRGPVCDFVGAFT